MSTTLTYCKYVNLYSERWCMSVKWSGCSNLNRWDLFYRTLCMLHDEDKLSIQWPCSGDFRRFARVFLFVVNTLTVSLSFCYIFKDFVRQLKVHCEQSLFFFRFSESNARARERRSRVPLPSRAINHARGHCVSRLLLDGLQKKKETARSLQLKAFPPSFCHFCACEMSPGWGHLITWMDPGVGHLNGILARVGGNLNNNFQKSQMPGWLPGVGGGGACWSFDLTDTLPHSSLRACPNRSRHFFS